MLTTGAPGGCRTCRMTRCSRFPDGVAGIWSGSLEGYSLQSGSDVITLTLDQSATGYDQIHLVFGTAQPPPPANNASQEWPPADYAQSNLPQDRRGPFDGYPYYGHLVEWQGRRLKFAIASMEPWDRWCIQQRSFPRAGSSAEDATFTCFPNIDCSSCAATPPPPASTLCPVSTEVGPFVTCAQYINCNGVYDYCVCDADLCEAPPYRDIAFDITFNDDTRATAATGFVQLNSLVPLRLMR